MYIKKNVASKDFRSLLDIWIGENKLHYLLQFNSQLVSIIWFYIYNNENKSGCICNIGKQKSRKQLLEITRSDLLFLVEQREKCFVLKHFEIEQNKKKTPTLSLTHK